jgi:tetratricopeptide (TPR) repeat protein
VLTKPQIITTNKTLPFDALSPAEFERMCLWLVEREGYLRPQHLGEAGNEQGRDIIAYRTGSSGEELWYFQCKRHKRPCIGIFKEEINKYNKLVASDPTKRPAGVIFIISSSVSARLREIISTYCHAQGFNSEFWARTELDMRVKKYPEIVGEFFYQSSIPTTKALHQIPPPPRDFTGREAEIAAILTAFDHGGDAVLGIFGMAGVGKTTLASKITEHLIPKYPDAQIYIDLKGSSREPVSTADVMLHVIRSFQPTATLPENESELNAQYISAFHDRHVLLLLDNVSGCEQVESLLPPVGCALIVTSRERFHLPGLLAVNLSELPSEDACGMLLTIAPRIGGQAGEIADLCGYLPLALRHAATTLAERVNLGVSDYIRRLSDLRERLKPITGPLNLSYKLLTPETQELWRKLAVFPGTFSEEAAVVLWDVSLDAAQDVLGRLVKYSLVEWDEATKRYRLHDLVRLFADEHLEEVERRLSQQRHAIYYYQVLKTANTMYSKGAEYLPFGLSLFDLEWSNIQSGQSWATAHTQEDNLAASLCSRYPDAGAFIFHLRIHPREGIRWRESALAAALRLNDREAEEAHLSNLGMSYVDLGKLRSAIELYKTALVISRERGDRHNESQELNNLGMAYANLGEMHKAIEFLEKSLLIGREIGDRKCKGVALGNLASIHQHLGNYPNATSHYEEALKILREIGDRRNEGNLLSGLGVLYSVLGDAQRAIELHQQALSTSREFGDLRGEANSLGNLGWSLGNLGEPTQALEYHQQQLSIAREIDDPHNEGSALYGAGVAFEKLGDVARAIKSFEQALEIFDKTGERFSKERALGDLGNLYSRIGRRELAIEYFEKQLILAREIGDQRGEAAAIWNNALSVSNVGNIKQAIADAETALEVFEKIGDIIQVEKIQRFLEQWKAKAENM